MHYDNLLELVKNRRSCRKFKTAPVSDEDVQRIIEVARWAPSGAHAQPWEFIVINQPESKKRIIETMDVYNKFMRKIETVRKPELRFIPSPPGFVRAPVFIILCGDRRTSDAYPLHTKQLREASHFVSGMASAFLYMNLAATTLGLGTQWVSAIAHPYVQTMIKDFLGVPPAYEFYDMLAVGYPVQPPKEKLVRNRDEMVHFNAYDQTKYRTDAEIECFITGLRQARKQPQYLHYENILPGPSLPPA
ncbi:nitroreductase family protein [Chloroflexota bacterium]